MLPASAGGLRQAGPVPLPHGQIEDACIIIKLFAKVVAVNISAGNSHRSGWVVNNGLCPAQPGSLFANHGLPSSHGAAWVLRAPTVGHRPEHPAFVLRANLQELVAGLGVDGGGLELLQWPGSLRAGLEATWRIW